MSPPEDTPTHNDHSIELECELFERLVDQDAESRRAILTDLREDSPSLCRRVEALLQVHTTAETATVARATSSPSRAKYLPGDQIDAYQIAEFLGSGGEAEVYLARQTSPIQRDVAIKVLRQQISNSATHQARFQAEKSALARLVHPGIAKIFDAGTTPDDEPYFVVEYIQGTTINKYLAQQNLTLRQRLAIFSEICNAVQYANENGIFHRDIKPSNIIVADIAGTPRPVVIDFGIAKVIDIESDEHQTLTRQGDLLGTLGYIAPERLSDARICNSQSEVYSLGAVLYELICAQPAVSVDSTRGIFAAVEMLKSSIVTKPSERLIKCFESDGLTKESHELAGQVAGELDWICMRSIEKDPHQRYASVREFRNDICRFLDGQPVEAAPPNWRYQTRKFYQRHRLVCVLAATVLTLLCICVIGSTYWALKLDAANRAANELVAESQNDSLHILTVLEFMTTAFDDPKRQAASVAICGEQLFNTPALEQELRRTDKYDATEYPTTAGVFADSYVLPDVPEDLLDEQRILFHDQFLRKQTEKFGPESPFLVATLLEKAKSEIRLERASGIMTLLQARLILNKLGRPPSDPQINSSTTLFAEAKHLMEE